MNQLTIMRSSKGYMPHERCGGWGCTGPGGCGGEGEVDVRRGWKQPGVEYSLRCSAAEVGLDLDADRATVDALAPVLTAAMEVLGPAAAQLPRGREWLVVMLREWSYAIEKGTA